MNRWIVAAVVCLGTTLALWYLMKLRAKRMEQRAFEHLDRFPIQSAMVSENGSPTGTGI